jgi:hypothetical protein
MKYSGKTDTSGRSGVDEQPGCATNSSALEHAAQMRPRRPPKIVAAREDFHR